MYTPETFSHDLSRVVKASQDSQCVRACLLMTRDRDYAIGLLKKTVVDCNCPFHHFTVAGRRRYNPKQLKWDEIGGESPDPTALLRYADELKNGGIVVFEDCTAFLCDEGGDLRVRATLAQMLSSESKRGGIVLVFMEPPESESKLPAMLADQFVRLNVPYPRAQELAIICREEIMRSAHRADMRLDVDIIRSQAERLSSGVVGLSRSGARDAMRDALAPDPGDFDAAFQRLQTRKEMQLSRELAMNVLDTSDSEEPVGLDYLVEYLKTRKNRMRVTGSERAKGVLLIGPPGTGKTMLARMIGRLVELSVVEFRISSLMNSLLGETERRFSQAFTTLEAMSPNVVFIDEIEKAFGDSSERDGGTMMRCTGSLLSWLSDNPYPNFIVATSNSLRRMGEIGLTMTRSGRFDTSYFIDVPSLESRRLMLERWLTEKMNKHSEAADECASMSERFSGADLRSIVKQAMARVEFAGEELTMDILKAEIERKRMRAIAIYDEFQELRRWGGMYCEPAGPTDA